jgi:hypothetical protein
MKAEALAERALPELPAHKTASQARAAATAEDLAEGAGAATGELLVAAQASSSRPNLSLDTGATLAGISAGGEFSSSVASLIMPASVDCV